jgi:orotate phosphoribosyltransferase
MSATQEGGNKEKVTGTKNNPLLPPGTIFVVGEELINFAESTVNSALELRSLGYIVDYGLCILHYDNPVANKALSDARIEIIYLFTLTELLDVAEKHKTHDLRLIAAYREFLAAPEEWNTKRGFEKLETGGTI